MFIALASFLLARYSTSQTLYSVKYVNHRKQILRGPLLPCVYICAENYWLFMRQIRVFVCSDEYLDWFLFSWVGDGPFPVRGAPKEPIPHGFNVVKGPTHVAVTREFVEFAVNDQRAQDLLSWMSDIKVPDEHFFQTLNHNPHMDIPGSFIG